MSGPAFFVLGRNGVQVSKAAGAAGRCGLWLRRLGLRAAAACGGGWGCGPLRPVAAAGAAGSCMVQRLRGHCSICRYRAFSASERVPTRSIRPSATASSP